MNHDKRYIWFDFIRGLSAIMVCISHLRTALLVDFGEVTHPTPVAKLFYFFSGLGHQSVMVFFVLSGFFVGGSVLGKAERFTWKAYSAARLSRLWVVLLPALLFTLAVDLITNHYNPLVLPGNYAAMWNSGPSLQDPWSVSPLTFIGNVLFLQTLAVPVFGTNGPLWSLAREFWYYVFFPMILGVFGLIPRKKMAVVIYLVVLAVAAYCMPGGLWNGFAIWMFGVAAWWLPSLGKGKNLILLGLGAIFFGGAILVSKSSLLHHLIDDLLVGLTFAVVVYAFRSVDAPPSRIFQMFSKGISEISYSLYLFHFPCVIFIAGVIFKGKQIQPTLPNLAYVTAIMLAIIAGASVFWWLFERNTVKIRKLVTR